MVGPSKSNEKDKPNGEQKTRRRPGRVPVSCAECRRLKLRCDRKIPCETCVKRGCSAICPEGSLTTGKGNRLALADAEELHQKIDRLRNRCNALEDALRALQSAVSDDPHPLLRSEADSPSSTAVDHSNSSGSPADGPGLTQDEERILDAFGTLTLGLRGESRFYGQTSRSEYLIHAPEQNVPSGCCNVPHLSERLVKEAYMDLDVHCTDLDAGKELFTIIPTLSQACRLCDIFLEYGQFAWCPLPRKQLFDEILGSVYRSPKHEQCDAATAHSMSVLLMVFALATLFDPDMPPYAVEAYEYYLLARVALRYAPPAYDTTLMAVQAMIYMAQWLEMSDCEPAHTGSQKAWTQIGLAVHLGHSIGLHVNGSRWKLDEEASNKRGLVFWQLFLHDTWLSFGFGRPPSMSLAFIDCDFPRDPEERIDENGEKDWGFHPWLWQYTRLLHGIISTTFGAKTPPYSTILELDRKIRDFPVPVRLRVKCGQTEAEPPTPGLQMQRFLAMAAKEATLLNLHRAYFAYALNEQPQDLLRHRCGPSVMAIYRSAWRMIEGARENYNRVPAISSRMGSVWSQCLAAGIVMCLLVTRAPSSTLASSSVQELDKLCDLFERAAGSSQVASNNLDVVRKLRRQGHEAINRTQSQDNQGIISAELDRLGGKTHLISSTYRSYICVPSERGKDASSQVLPEQDAVSQMPSVPFTPVSTESIHPTIMHDMRAFDGLLDTSNNPQFNLDFPSTSFSPLQPAAEYFPPEFNFNEPIFASPTFTNGHVDPNGPPVLDATWQSFVEQLGF